jgi:hypothetical protein
VVVKKTIVKILAVIAVVSLILPAFCGAIEFKGMSYCGWDANAYSTADSNTSLARLKDTGCQWVAINVWWFQDTINSTVIEPNYTLYSVRPESVKVAVDRCHQLGMKVMLKPNVDLAHDSGHWRGQIVPSTAWFNEYHNFINFWADFAEQNNVELFCIGCELVNTSSWADAWRWVANDVRTHYSGPIVYAANHGDEQNINWWDALDYIGIDAYYALTGEYDPTPAELASAWTNRANSIQTWRNAYWPSKQIIFTEVGYSSYDGANTQPWHWPAIPPVDVNEQADCYEALLSVCSTRPWWQGAFWWNWETDPNAGGLTNLGFTPQNKPAEQVLKNHYITLAGDLDDDRDVDIYDLMMFCDYWPDSNIVGWPDFNNDKKVNFKDFALLAANWRQSIPPP